MISLTSTEAARPGDILEARPGAATTRMLGTAELVLAEHRAILTDTLAASAARSCGGEGEVLLRLADGQLSADALVLAAVSPFLRAVLQEALLPGPGGDTGDWVRDQVPIVVLPEVTVAEMRILLSLLYTGTTRVHQRQLSALVTLTHLLKLISIPVAIVDEPQTKKKSNKSRNKDALRHERATITFIPEKSNGRGRPAKMLTTSTPRDEKSRLESFPSDFLASGTSNKDKLSLSAVSLPAELTSRLETSFNPKLAEMLPTPASSQPELGSKRTVDYTVAVPLSEAESDMEELVEEMHVFVSDEGRVERLELLQDRDPLREQGEEKPGPDPDTARLRDKVVAGKQGTVTLVQTEEAEGLDHLPNLISVAEAFERSQQPDFNDIASPVVDGTDTEKVLVRNCVICSKALLGRNALGRHMKNVHPAVFGPYRCPHPGCAKMIQSGAKMVTHMYHHTGGRARPHPELDTRPPDQEAASSLATPEKNQNVPAEAAAAESGSKKLTFECNAGVEDCKDSFTTARGFIKHMKDVHNMKPWYCEPCDKRFMERQNLQFHMMSHGNKKNFACDICNKSFANPRQLYTHRALHLGKRYLCQECGYRARSSANLRGHVKTKHEAKQHICKMCSKKFSSGNNLKNHMRIHTGESPYECELCGVKFKRVHHLHSHIESKMHIEVMDKCRRKGHQVPQHLDPLRRVRGRACVEDGPVTLASNQTQLETHITEVNDDGWPLHQVVVVEENAGSFSIPVEQAQIEIIQDAGAANTDSGYVLSV